jgi:hypothetical protein
MDSGVIISAIGQAVSAFIAAVAIYQTVRLHKKQILLEQRQLLLPLWSYLQALNDIDPSEPVWIDVIKAVNTLELIAVCWEGQLIDENIIRRMYSQLYIELYQKVEECKNPPPRIAKDGKQMLLACPAAMSLYRLLIAEHADRDKLKPID